MSSRYTTLENPKVDGFVQEHLDRIKNELIKLMGKDLESIILTGGFGRGEGSVRVYDSGSMHIVNDYDIEVIYRERFSQFISKAIMQLRYRNNLKRVADSLAEKYNIKQIDLVLRAPSSFHKNTPPQLANFDMRYGNQLLYGEINPADILPQYKATDIPAFEGTWLLRNRGCGLLLARLYFKDKQLLEGKEEYFYIEVNKAILAMGDALFIAAGTYHHSYAYRRNNISSVLPADFSYSHELGELYRLAARYKLEPTEDMFPQYTPLELWNLINHIYVCFFLYYESQRSKQTFHNQSEYSEWAIKQSKPSHKLRFVSFVDNLITPYDPDARRLLAIKRDRPRSALCTLLLLSSYDNKNTNSQDLYAFLNATNTKCTDWPTKNWLYRVTRAFLLCIHPKGELGRFLSSESVQS